MSYQYILTEERGGIYIVTLNRPEAKNAINSAMWLELCQAFDYLEQTDSLRVGIITNVGDCLCGERFERNCRRHYACTRRI